jgi:radical SAM superfamily enzyme YgiQ (UPF0313 family)
MPRPTSFTEDVAASIVASVRAGNFKETASVASGICPRTLRNWIRRGTDGEEPFAEFVERMNEAEAQSEVDDIKVIVEAGKLDWKARAWRLERKAPKKWGFRVRVEVRDEIQAMLTKLEAGLTPAEFEKVLAIVVDDYGTATIGENVDVNGDPVQRPSH